MGTLVVTLSTRTEENIGVNWVAENSLNKLWYSINNGQSYVLTDQTGIDGYLSFYDLTPNTEYKIVLKGAEKNGAVIFSEILDISTYDYPFCNQTPDFTIGERLTLGFYNPLEREITVNLIGADGSVISNDTINSRTLTGFIDEVTIDRLYKSIKTSASAQYSVKVTYSDESTQATEGGHYSVDKSICAPTLGNIYYEDRDPFTLTITGNNQRLVRNRSYPFFYATGIHPQKHATIEAVNVILNEVTYPLFLGNTTAEGFGSAVDSATSLNAIFEVIDSRGLITQKEILVNIYDWFPAEASVEVKRSSNGASGLIKVDANFASVGGHNAVTVEYYSKKRSDSEYTYIGTLSSGVETTFVADSSYDWDVKVVVNDRFNSPNTYYATLSRYTPLVFFDAEKYSVGVNCLPTNTNTLEIKNEDIYAALFYSSGESYSFTGKKVYCAGLFRNDGVYFSFYVPKSMKNVTPTITVLKGNICQYTTGFFSGDYVDGGRDFLNAGSSTVTFSKQNDYEILVVWQRNYSTSVPNNSLCTIELNALTVNFS